MQIEMTLNDDVVGRLRALQTARGICFEDAVNLALRTGLDRLEPLAAENRGFRSSVHDGGHLKPPFRTLEEAIKATQHDDDIRKHGI